MNLADEVFDVMPLSGENIRTIESPVVYYFDGSLKHIYPNENCYFSLGNPPFSEHYSRGGIKFVTQRVIDMIPDGETLCSENKQVIQKRVLPPIPTEIKQYTKKNFLLANF
ncbi:MAG: hypothetical protein SNJ77_11845, partial [Cytophagales bacterium]